MSLCVQELHHPPNVPWILAAIPGSQNHHTGFTGFLSEFLQPLRDFRTCATWVGKQRVSPFYHGLFFICFWEFLVGLVNLLVIGSHQTTGFTVLSSTLKLDTGTGEVSPSYRSSLPRVSLSRDVAVVGEEDELEEDVEQCISCLVGVIEVEGWRTRWQAWNHDRKEVLRVTLYSNTVFNEMWFLTIDPFIIRFHRKAFRATILLACFRGLS